MSFKYWILLAVRLFTEFIIWHFHRTSYLRLEPKRINEEMLQLEKIPDQIGYLVLNEEGAVLTSGGELENDERSANIIHGLISLTDK